MIARIWHGRTSPGNAESYLQFLLEDGTKEYLETEGNISVKVWRKQEEECCHFWTITEWKDVESVKAFAGSDYDKAKYYPQDQGILLEFEEKVNHYESHDLSNVKVKDYIRQLDQLYHGGSWQGESFTDKLNTTSDIDAFTEPTPGVHSVAEIVWHCIYWRTVLLKRLDGNNTYREETAEKLNFLPLTELKQRGWESLQRQFEQAQLSLIKKLKEMNDVFLEKEFQPGYTCSHLVEGIIQHDIYHLGQIGLVKKMISLR